MNENYRTWIARLRSGEVSQAYEMLGYADGSRCCLGVACDVAGVSVDETMYHTIFDGYAIGLMPASVVRWLGFGHLFPPGEVDPDSQEWDLVLDYDHGVRTDQPWSSAAVSCAWLNDARLTFDQIADMVEYFGIRELTGADPT